MKEKRIKIIVALMTAALVGLIGFQYYLIENLVRVEKDKFDRLVNEALSDIVSQVDKKEAFNVLQNQLVEYSDTLVNNDEVTINKVIKDTSVSYDSVTLRQSNFTFTTKLPSGKKKNSIFVMTTADTNTSNKDRLFINESRDTVFLSKMNLVNQVVTELITKNNSASVEERLNTIQFDSLLNRELNDRGIDIKHNFGVVQKNKLIFLPKGSDSTQVVNSKFDVRLFPSDLDNNRDRLKVYFADTSSYILRNIFWMLLLSALFLITIGFIFFTTIQMLLRQKKITEIKNDLINNITHEFKTPLSTISLAADALNDPSFSKSEDSLKKYSGMISAENKRLTSMVESLLNAAAFETGDYKLSLEKIKIHSLLEKVVNQNREFFKSYSAEIKLNFNADNNQVEADEFHLANVFKNIIENGIKYNENQPVIEIYTENKNDSIFIHIKDNGIGILKEHQNKIFDTFYRVPTGNIHNVKGNGIGLSYVNKMISVHKGSISLKSKLSEGSTFIIKLPLSSK